MSDASNATISPMTTTETSPTRIFADARRMLNAALERMGSGDIRDAAEKAWCATLRATEALVLARTGREPGKSPDASRRLSEMADADPSLGDLELQYFRRQARLHGECFYHELCPMPGTERFIRETLDFIRGAEALAQL